MGKIKGSFAQSYDRFVKRQTLLPSGLMELVRSYNARDILELASGTGTVAIGLAQNGLNVIGVDYSPNMLKSARKKAKDHDVKLKFVMSDILTVDLKCEFDLILCLGNTVPQFTSEARLGRFFQNCRRHLKKPGGVLIFQQLNYDRILRDRPRTFAADLDGELARFKQYRYRGNLIDFVVTMINGTEIPPAISISKIILRPWTSRQLTHSAKKAGFDGIVLYGDYNKSAFSKESMDLVFVGFTNDN